MIQWIKYFRVIVLLSLGVFSGCGGGEVGFNMGGGSSRQGREAVSEFIAAVEGAECGAPQCIPVNGGGGINPPGNALNNEGSSRIDLLKLIILEAI